VAVDYTAVKCLLQKTDVYGQWDMPVNDYWFPRCYISQLTTNQNLQWQLYLWFYQKRVNHPSANHSGQTQICDILPHESWSSSVYVENNADNMYRPDDTSLIISYKCMYVYTVFYLDTGMSTLAPGSTARICSWRTSIPRVEMLDSLPKGY